MLLINERDLFNYEKNEHGILSPEFLKTLKSKIDLTEFSQPIRLVRVNLRYLADASRPAKDYYSTGGTGDERNMITYSFTYKPSYLNKGYFYFSFSFVCNAFPKYFKSFCECIISGFRLYLENYEILNIDDYLSAKTIYLKTNTTVYSEIIPTEFIEALRKKLSFSVFRKIC